MRGGIVKVDELGEEWTDEKLCRVTEDAPTKVCLKEEEWLTLWTAHLLSAHLLYLSLSVSAFQLLSY